MFPAFVLTIDSDRGLRRRHSDAECARLCLGCVFVAGVTTTSPEIARTYSPWLNLVRSKRSLTAGEIACYVGHRRVWQAVLDSGHDIALVCEDDFTSIDDDVFRAVLDHAPARADWDILKLFDFAPKPVVQAVPMGPVHIVDYKYPAAGAVCYLIRREAARRLLTRPKVFRPVDEDFLYCWEFGLRVRSVSPNPVAEDAPGLGGSILEADRKSRKRRKNRVRSLWGMWLAGVKQIRARSYRRELAAADRRRGLPEGQRS